MNNLDDEPSRLAWWILAQRVFVSLFLMGRQLLEDAPAVGVQVERLSTKALKPKQKMMYGTLATPACGTSAVLVDLQ